MRGRVLAVLACACVLTAPVAWAQPAPTAAAPAPKPSFDAAKLRATIGGELAQAREKLDTAAAQAPSGVSAEDRESARKAQTMLVHVLAAQLETLDRIARHEQERDAADKAEREWTGFSQAAPYSNLLFDDLREQVTTHRAAVELLRGSRSGMQTEAGRFRDRAKQAEEEMRRAAEAVEGRAAASDARAAAANWRLDSARDRSRLASAIVATGDLSARELDLRLAVAQAQLRLAERQLAAVTGNVKITKADVESAQARLDAARAQWDRDLQAAIRETGRWQKERETAIAELEARRAALRANHDSAGHDYPLRLAEARLRAADAWNNSLAQQIRILTPLVTVYHDRIAEAWQWRYEALSGGDASTREVARRQLVELVEYLKGWDSRSRTQQNEIRSTIQELDQRVLSESDPQILKYDREALAALRQVDVVFERQQAILARRLGRLQYWREDFSGAQSRSPGEIAGEVYVRAASLAKDIWNYELLKIEDKVEIGGQTLTTSRGVTIGKSVGAILLFFVALRLMLFLSVRTERLMVRRFGVEPQKAKMMRRWVNAFGIMMVLVIILNLARIPLTVFAFAGGALAIGIGFGMQTLIKNLISGVIVLLERHVRVGDVIEVEGVTGRVTAVDIRSSTVRGFDGVENMIPNAALLEQKVTNWTLTNAHLRRVVKIGVAYGSPARTVAQILEQCAMRHGLVLKEPAPLVIFEDFGDNALIFALYFWIDLSPSTNSMQVMSDLRFMIDKEMREAGVDIAFPQRDIHLDAKHPIRIELASLDELPVSETVRRPRSGAA